MVGFGLLTGQMTGAIVTANSPPPPDMRGRNIGALRFRDHDSYTVVHHGGFPVRNINVTDFYSDVTQLIEKVCSASSYNTLSPNLDFSFCDDRMYCVEVVYDMTRRDAMRCDAMRCDDLMR